MKINYIFLEKDKGTKDGIFSKILYFFQNLVYNFNR